VDAFFELKGIVKNCQRTKNVNWQLKIFNLVLHLHFHKLKNSSSQYCVSSKMENFQKKSFTHFQALKSQNRVSAKIKTLVIYPINGVLVKNMLKFVKKRINHLEYSIIWTYL
jgi:hypothetical protein